MTAGDLDTLRHQLRRDEDLRLFPYPDVGGKITIGFGRNLTDRGITLSEADVLFDHDLGTAILELAAAYPWTTGLDSARQTVLVNMLFNLGLTRFRGFTKMLAAAEAGDYERAALEMMDSRWATQVGTRATRLASVMLSGELK